MHMTQLVHKLGRNDVRLIRRDSFLIFMLAFVVIIAVMLRYGMPWLNNYLAANGVMPGDNIAISLADVYPMLVAYMALYTGALLVGSIFGFVLLEEKDDNTIKAMLVTPVPLQQYVLYRVGIPAILASGIILAMMLFINQALVPLRQLLILSAGAALTAPIISLYYATFAENKVQGFAMSKFAGIAGWTIVLGWFTPEPWQWLLGIFPPFWISKAYWMALAGNGWWWGVWIAGIVLQAGLIYLLMQRFNRVAYH